MLEPWIHGSPVWQTSGPPRSAFLGASVRFIILKSLRLMISKSKDELKTKPQQIKLLPQKLGDSVIFSKSGLSAFWTNILPMLSSCTIYLGKLDLHTSWLHVTVSKNETIFKGFFWRYSLAKRFINSREVFVARFLEYFSIFRWRPYFRFSTV